MPPDTEDPPIRLLLAALFLAGRHASGKLDGRGVNRAAYVGAALDDADELLRQAGPL